jgi:hypothetical protein
LISRIWPSAAALRKHARQHLQRDSAFEILQGVGGGRRLADERARTPTPEPTEREEASIDNSQLQPISDDRSATRNVQAASTDTSQSQGESYDQFATSSTNAVNTKASPFEKILAGGNDTNTAAVGKQHYSHSVQ